MSVRKREWVTGKGEAKTAWVVDFADEKGVRRLKTFKLKKQADAFAASTSVAISGGEFVADRATSNVSEAAKNWIRSGADAGLERTTVDQRCQHVRFHIEPFLGAEKLTKLTVPIIREWQDRLRNEGRSPAMVKRATVSLGSILGDAQERGLLARNPVREMSSRGSKARSKVERRQKRRAEIGRDIPTGDEVRRIIEAAEGRWRPLLLTAIFSGLRASELRGLRWCDVEIAKARLHVRQRADRYGVVGMPKSDAGQRTVPLPPLVVNALREWRLQCPKGDLDLVFPTGRGNIENHGNIVNRGWWPTQVAAGVAVDTGEKDEEGAPILKAKYTGLHALRHWFASWCINRRADGGLELPPKSVQARLGHSSINITMDVYGHLYPSRDDAEALAAAERALMAPAHAT